MDLLGVNNEFALSNRAWQPPSEHSHDPIGDDDDDDDDDELS
jgi:hypothetical protein